MSVLQVVEIGWRRRYLLAGLLWLTGMIGLGLILGLNGIGMPWSLAPVAWTVLMVAVQWVMDKRRHYT
jgi:hypothetical protein